MRMVQVDIQHGLIAQQSRESNHSEQQRSGNWISMLLGPVHVVTRKMDISIRSYPTFLRAHNIVDCDKNEMKEACLLIRMECNMVGGKICRYEGDISKIPRK